MQLLHATPPALRDISPSNNCSSALSESILHNLQILHIVLYNGNKMHESVLLLGQMVFYFHLEVVVEAVRRPRGVRVRVDLRLEVYLREDLLQFPLELHRSVEFGLNAFQLDTELFLFRFDGVANLSEKF